MKITEFRRLMLDYEAKARDRKAERLDANDDTPWYNQVIEEFCIDIIEREKALASRIDQLEAMLIPDSKG